MINKILSKEIIINNNEEKFVDNINDFILLKKNINIDKNPYKNRNQK